NSASYSYTLGLSSNYITSSLYPIYTKICGGNPKKDGSVSHAVQKGDTLIERVVIIESKNTTVTNTDVGCTG
ncbi:hypothetical protein L9F63_021313, partial [Diploptera punctata]